MRPTAIHLCPVLLATAGWLVATATASAAPNSVPFQGRVSVDGIPFSGAGQFRFALVAPTGTPVWTSAPDTSPADGTPDTPVTLTVTKGLYAVRLGSDTGPLPEDAFARYDDLRLRVWFDDGSHGIQQLAPDTPLGAVPYARHSAAADLATFATSAASASTVSGKVPSTQLDGVLASAQLPPVVARLDSSPTFTGTIRAAGFEGAGTFRWQRVTQSEVVAHPNTGYLYDADATLAVTLPRVAEPGDVVRISVANGLGWFATAENGGQLLGGMAGRFWNAGGLTAPWRGLAMSSDGTHLVAASDPGPIAVSANGGDTWRARADSRHWTSVASSADGRRLAATEFGGRIWISNDAGETWNPRGADGTWSAIAGSSDGQRLVAVQTAGIVAVSTDGGETWNVPITTGRWTYATCSADGQTLGIGPSGRTLMVSLDGGASWYSQGLSGPLTDRTVVLSTIGPFCISADGTRWYGADVRGGIWTWATDISSIATLLPGTSNTSPEPVWASITCSANGDRVLAAEFTGRVWHSANRGRSWIRSAGPESWRAVACSLDGLHLAAAPALGEIIHSEVWFRGSPSTTAEFVHAGSGRWLGHVHAVLEPDERFAVERIPDLPADKITSGTLDAARLPQVSPASAAAPAAAPIR